MVKKTNSNCEQTESTDNSTNLPNDLISILQHLKEKLTNMNEFYDKNITDDTFEDGMLRQIQELRTQKYKEIEKLK